jgi:pimeloyl-ACP methyl ester carboxylesterase
MTATKPHHLLTLPDGRVAAVDEHGSTDPSAPVVVLIHSSPGSRLLDPDPAATAAAGVRLLTMDRAGFGDSSPVPEGATPRITGQADDVAAALAGLGVAEAAVVGWSHGGHVALALAARQPELVRAVALCATPASDEDVPWLPEEHRAMLRSVRDDPERARATLTEVMAPLAEHPDAALAQFATGEADEAVAAADTGGRLRRYLAAAYAQGAGGVACDIVARHVVPWGYDARAVGAPVALFYGEGDAGVTPAHGEHWHTVLADATLHRVPGAGHLVPLVTWAETLAAVAR